MNLCRYCSGERALAHIGAEYNGFGNNQHLYIEGRDLQLAHDDPRVPSVYIPISFCPHCGRKLKEEISTRTA